MPTTSGFNHIATLTTDLDRFTRWYADVFGARVTMEMDASDEHPRMAIVDVGGGAALNVFEVPEESLIGERRRIGGRGAIDTSASRCPTGRRSTRCATGWSGPARTSATCTAGRRLVALLPRRRRHGAGGLRPRRLTLDPVTHNPFWG